MAALSWNEIRQRAIQFSREWHGVQSERAEAQTFWNEFFDVFGIKRRIVASFEEPVRSLKETYHFIDLFWKGTLLAEHKSASGSLAKAESQAFQYIQELASSGRGDEVPRYIVLSNFHHIAIYDLEPDEQAELPLWEGHQYELIEFPLSDLHLNVKRFAFITGQKTHRFGEEDPANLKAAQLMADLHDAVEASGYSGAPCERLLVRLLFCLFAEDTGIFDPASFELYLKNHTRADGSDMGAQLSALFEILNTHESNRPALLDEDMAAFPYVNGELFKEHLPLVGFNRDMRGQILTCCAFDWSRISPAIFGSLFQGILDKGERRQIGAHYTTERNILKVIRPLFLDALHEEFEQLKADKSTRRTRRLRDFQQKLASLKLLDPACGCGNFLVIAYRELRRLELELLKLLYDFEGKGKELDLGEIAKLSKVYVDQFYGIEIGDWPARIAETALWLADHQMNIELSLAAGNQFQRIPLGASPHIRCENALRVDWGDVLPAEECSYVLGNPPFIGAKEKTKDQRGDLDLVWTDLRSHRTLDYVTAWYRRALEYITGTSIQVAFVSTNSITQGEQVGVFWPEILRMGAIIRFAHRTFAWQSEAKGKAHVHCVIIGFSLIEPSRKVLFEYDDINGEPTVLEVTNISPYLVDTDNTVLVTRSRPVSSEAPLMTKGSEATDWGHLIMGDAEKRALVSRSPRLEKFIRRFTGGQEYINDQIRWCFWFVDYSPRDFRSDVEIRERLEHVRNLRAKSKKNRTRELAATPYLFGEIRQPTDSYLIIPKVSSERRAYIPVGFLPPEVIANGSALIVPKATCFHFGIISSNMHMSWMRLVCGRMKSDYQYSVSIVYNNYPWPVDATKSQRSKVEVCAQAVLDKREEHLKRGSSLADLYDPLYMPSALLKAHKALDRAVDRCYRGKKFGSELDRVEFLFQLYEKLAAPLAPKESQPRKKKRIRRKAR